MAGPVVRIVACGSVDDGKSTLIGRLLADAGAVPSDQLAALGETPDWSLLVDGLSAEREQGITIDVAHRYFDLDGRRFILADTPGHEQYTRNMATAASTADAAIVLVDARKGVATQTRRHARVLALMGVGRVLLAVNKMDLVEHDRARFEAIAAEFAAFASDIGLTDVSAAPVIAPDGGNLIRRSEPLSWFEGPTVAQWLGAAAPDGATGGFRLPVQSVVRSGEERTIMGRLLGGGLKAGDPVRILPSGVETTIARILDPSGDRSGADAGQSVAITLAGQVDVSRGDVLASPLRPPAVSDQFEAHLVWMSSTPLLPGRAYELRIGSASATARISDLKHRVDVDSGEALAGRTLGLNEIGLATLALDTPVPFEPYAGSRELGGFILIDRQTAETSGAGMIRFALRRADNVRPQPLSVSRQDRAAIKHQTPLVVWFTGLSGAGKSSIADRVEQRLHAEGLHSAVLDGDNVRGGLNRDLGFTDADRVENIRRVAEVARLMTDAGLIVLVSFISPFRAERQMARETMAPGEFVEVHVDAPLEVVEARDVKGLYRKAREGRLTNFTGIDSPYEPPEAPDLRIDTTALSLDEAADRVMGLIRTSLSRR